MFDYDLELDIEQELSEIPPEYQDTFRQALAEELAETKQNRTDMETLNYLRSRRDDFKRGGFIRPDGRPGLVALSPEALYEQALPQLAQSSLGEEDNTAERRRTLFKLGLFAAIALAFLIFVFRGRAQRTDEQLAIMEGTPAADASDTGTAVATPALPEITGIDDALQTIGGLGGALTIGRPSTLELHYSRTEETIALPIDPSKPTTRGELRYSEATMLSENPVAVWLFGTVLNYAIGIPDSLVRNLEHGDRIVLNTDTGAALHFVVAETGQGASYEASRLLSQNRLGLTLFALPAVSESAVSLAFASYDIASEEGQGQVVYEVGDSFSLTSAIAVQVTAAQYSHTADGSLRIVVAGEATPWDDEQTVMLSLTSSSEQTAAVSLAIDEQGLWQATYTMPDRVTGLPLFAEFRTLPGGELAVVHLGDVPDLINLLEVALTGAWWDGERTEAVLAVSIHNPGAGEIYLGSEFIQVPAEGGDAYALIRQVTPRLPVLIHPGETMGLAVSFLPQRASMRLQIGADLWEVTGLPVE